MIPQIEAASGGWIYSARRPAGIILATVAASILLGGCLQKESPFEVTATDNGAYLLNKDTGELKFIVGTRLLPVEAPSTTVEASMSAKTWPADKPTGTPGVSIELRTKYRDGQMLYIAEASPYEGLLERARLTRFATAAYSVYLYDSDGFPTSDKLDLALREGTPVVGADGKLMSLQWSGSIPMSAVTYAAIQSTNTGWSGFPPAE